MFIFRMADSNWMMDDDDNDFFDLDLTTPLYSDEKKRSGKRSQGKSMSRHD